MNLLQQLTALRNAEKSVTEAEDTNFPKLLAHAGEFRVELDEDEQVHILDGEQTVRVSMPLVIWKQLQRS